MTIEIFEGTPGSGKSFCAIEDMMFHIIAGGVVASNFLLSPDWAMRLSRSSTLFVKDPKKLIQKARKYWNRAFYVGSSETVMKLSGLLRGENSIADRFCSEKMSKKREGVGRLYIDEAQLYFNSRNWKDNMGFIEFFTQHRKLKWDVVLIAHSIDMIDKQIKPLIEYQRSFRNLRKVKVLGFPITPWPIFMQVQKYAGVGAGKGMKSQPMSLTILKQEYADMYDSFDVFGFNGLNERIRRQPAKGLFPKKNNQKERKQPQLPIVASEPFPKYFEVIKP